MRSSFPVLSLISLITLPAAVHANVTITPAAGYTITWDGNDGTGFNPASPAPAPANLATAVGSEAFTSGDLGWALGLPYHLAANINDGLYGNANSWIGDDAPGGYAAIRLPRLATLSGFAFGRDNGNGAFDGSVAGTDCCGGQLVNRTLGVYTIQITRVAGPDGTLADTGDATTGWQTIGTLEYTGNEDMEPGGGFTAHFRHEYGIASGTSGIQATGFRILVPATGIANGTAIDEIELYGTAVTDFDKDGDGFDDIVEIDLGCDPNDPSSTPESKADLRTAVEFSFWAAKSQMYVIERSPDLTTWTTIEENIGGSGGEITRLYSILGEPKQHYRARRQP